MGSRASWGCLDSKFVFFLLGGSSVLGYGYHVWHAQSSPPSLLSASPSFDSARAVKYEEYKRYPCQVLHGWDVVVRNYYLPVNEQGEGGMLFNIREFGKQAFASFRKLFSDYRPQRLADTFAHSLQTPSSVRMVDNEEEGALSSSTWPPGTQKFSTLVLEPSIPANTMHNGKQNDEGQTGSEAALAPSSSALQKWVDAVTDQTVVRCDPMAPCRSAIARVQTEGGESTMVVSVPNCSNNGASLEAPYLRTMLSSLAWLPPCPSPLHVGILGVGGGAMAAFFLRYVGRAMNRLDLVDVEPVCLSSALTDLGLSTVLSEEDVVIIEGRTIHGRGVPDDKPWGTNSLNHFSLSSQSSHEVDSGVHLYAMNATDFLRQAAGGTVNSVAGPTPNGESGGSSMLKPFSPQWRPGFPMSDVKSLDVLQDSVEKKKLAVEKKDRLAVTTPRQSFNRTVVVDTIPTLEVDRKDSRRSATCQGAEMEQKNSLITPAPLSLPPISPPSSFSSSLFDLLIVDLFVGSLASEEQSRPNFLKLCRENLTSNGVAVFNIPHRLPEFERMCEVVFGKGQVHAIPVPSSSNYVVIASKGRGGTISHRLRCRRAREVTKWLRLPYALDKELPFLWSYW